MGWLLALAVSGGACNDADADGETSRDIADVESESASESASESESESESVSESESESESEVKSEVKSEVESEVFVPPEPPVSPALAAQLQTLLDDNLLAANAPGVALGVLLPDGSWWAGAAGLACIDPSSDVTPYDRFRIGSITKTWVAAATLQLVHEGTITLATPADTWVPGFDFGPEITVARLLNHTTGIFNLADDPFGLPAALSDPIEPRAMVAAALAHGPVFPPGTSWSYSNTNYVVLGLLLEAVEAKPVAEVLRARLLTPLGLEDTFLEAAEPVDGGFVCGHLFGFEATHIMHASWSWAAGAVVSNTRDMCRWADALYRGDVLPAGLRDAMLAPTTLPNGGTIDYGLGVSLGRRGGLDVVGHGGSTMGFEAELYIDPTSGLCVAVLTNDFDGSPDAVARHAWNLIVPTLQRP